MGEGGDKKLGEGSGKDGRGGRQVAFAEIGGGPRGLRFRIAAKKKFKASSSI